MKTKPPPAVQLRAAPKPRGMIGRVMAYAGRPGSVAEARSRAKAIEPGFTDWIDETPKWPDDQPEVLGPRRD